jgi:hypothetical protein
MSDLKWRTVPELYQAQKECETKIAQHIAKENYHRSVVAGQRTRLDWIGKYIFEKTPKEMTMAQVEQALGHKVLLK